MNEALIIGRNGNGNWFARSDYVAARMLQRHMADGDKDGVKVLRAEAREEVRQAMAERKHDHAELRAEIKEARDVARSERTDKVREVDAPRPIAAATLAASKAYGAERGEALAALREKVAEMSRALESLTRAMDAIGEFKFLIAEGDSASVVAFAGQVLADMRSEKAAEIAPDASDEPEPSAMASEVETESEGTTENAQTGSDDDVIDLNGAYISDVDGGLGNDTVTVTASVEARDIRGGEGNDTITVSAPQITGVYGGGGRDTIAATSAQSITGVDAGAGNDTIEITAPMIGTMTDGSGNDTVRVTARDVDDITLGAGDDVFFLEVARASLSVRGDNGKDVVHLRDGAHLGITLSDPAALSPERTSTEWRGNDLMIDFGTGDSILIANAANSGSLTLRAGDTVVNLRAETMQGEAMRMLDVSV